MAETVPNSLASIDKRSENLTSATPITNANDHPLSATAAIASQQGYVDRSKAEPVVTIRFGPLAASITGITQRSGEVRGDPRLGQPTENRMTALEERKSGAHRSVQHRT